MRKSLLEVYMILIFKFIFLSKTYCKYQIINEKGLRGKRIKFDIPADLLEDSNLKTNELIAKYGYPVETHFVITEDDYIVRIHRIARSGSKPFFLMHGFLDSSSGYILMGPSNSLGYYLWDQGYDVWIGNARGNRYSRNHTTLNPNDEQFWDFSFHEMGIYDLPAMIDYIISATGNEKLFYVGHSQGCTVFFIMCSKRPEYNNKIILMHALGPAVFESHVKSTITELAFLVNTTLTKMFYEFLPHNNFLRNICFDEKQKEIELFCIGFMGLNFGQNFKELNITMFAIMLGHVPAGAAFKQIKHYVQLYQSGLFQEYDYGPTENMRNYGTRRPPSYDLSKVTAPVVLYSGENDLLTVPVDIEHLKGELPNVMKLYTVPNLKWNHMDFLYGKSAKFLINKQIFDMSNLFPRIDKENV